MNEKDFYDLKIGQSLYLDDKRYIIAALKVGRAKTSELSINFTKPLHKFCRFKGYYDYKIICKSLEEFHSKVHVIEIGYGG